LHHGHMLTTQANEYVGTLGVHSKLCSVKAIIAGIDTKLCCITLTIT
jgi:hypothetical protein